MTVICALCDATSKEVWLGCNDGITIGDTRMPGVSKNKWQSFGDWALGTAGSPLPGDVLETAREHFPEDGDAPSIIIEFVKAVFDEGEFGSRDDDDPSTIYPVVGMLAQRDGRLWDVDPYLAIVELQPGTLWARGSGIDYALGADFPMRGTEASAEDRVRNAVEAAMFYDTGCPGKAMVARLE